MSGCWRDGADGDPCRADVVAFEPDVGRRVGHGDVHLVAGDEALPGGAAVRRGRREVQRDDELARLQHVAAGARVEVLDRDAAASPLGPAMLAVPCSTIMAGTESAAGPELQRLPPRLARPWIATPPMTVAASTSAG